MEKVQNYQNMLHIILSIMRTIKKVSNRFFSSHSLGGKECIEK